VDLATCCEPAVGRLVSRQQSFLSSLGIGQLRFQSGDVLIELRQALVTRDFSTRAALARSSRPLRIASSAFSSQSPTSASRVSSLRFRSFLSAIDRAAADLTSTSVSSISWIIKRTIFSGSSALSRIALMLEFTMSLNLVKIPMMFPLWMGVGA
jgi:hypothetical protein